MPENSPSSLETTDPLIVSSRDFIAEVSIPAGIEDWVKKGRTPFFHLASTGGKDYYMVHIPPNDATHASRYEWDEGGMICYQDNQDKEGIGLQTVIITLEEGEILLGRIQEALAPNSAQQLR